MQNQDISKLSLTELKALAYDASVEFRNAERNLKVISQQITKKLSEPKMDEETPVAEEATETSETTADETPAEETAAEETSADDAAAEAPEESPESAE